MAILDISPLCIVFFPSGYAVGAGHFLDPQSTEIVGGAPQNEQTGKVRVNNTTIIIFTYLSISTDPILEYSLVLQLSSLLRLTILTHCT